MQKIATPPHVTGLYDEPMWQYLLQNSKLHLQSCLECNTYRYPPGPVCHHCLSPNYDWKPVSGRGEILSWVIFHKQYLPEYPAPYNVIAVRLEEGPTFISNLVGKEPEGSWIGRNVRCFGEFMQDGITLPRFKLVDDLDE